MKKVNMKGVNNPRYIDGRKATRLYRIYNNMKTRCYNDKTPSYLNYGNRGVKICDSWLKDYNIFYKWSIENGYREGLTIDRINVDGNYEPSNCRWVTVKEQSNNTRKNHKVTLNNETKSLMEWCEMLNINYRTVRDRLKRNWSYEKALYTPVDIRFRRKKVV